MKRTIIILAIFAVMITACSASADTMARDALIAYSGTEAFTKLDANERQACMNWLVRGGTMTADCSNAVMKLVSIAPDAVTPEQRQALIAEASGNAEASSVKTSAGKSMPVPETTEPQITKKNDDTGKIVAIGLIGLLAGLVIHNNVKHHKSSSPSYTPEPPRPAPQGRNTPPQANRPPQSQTRPQPRPVNRPIDKRPPQR